MSNANLSTVSVNADADYIKVYDMTFDHPAVVSSHLATPKTSANTVRGNITGQWVDAVAAGGYPSCSTSVAMDASTMFNLTQVKYTA